MAAGQEDFFPHLRLVDRSLSQPYRPKNAIPAKLKLKERERAAHGARLLGLLENIEPVLEQRKLERQALNITAPDGITLEFQSPEGFDLAFESLDNSKAGIELLNVRVAGGVMYSTCFVPDGKLPHLVKKIQAYLDKETPAKEPKNKKLVESIESIGLATIDALWTDSDPMPVDDAVYWWEIWLRSDGLSPENAFLRFKAAAEVVDIRVTEQWFAFPERIVTNVCATRSQLAQSVVVLNLAAEIRHADRRPTVPHDLGLEQQDNIIDGIGRRLELGDDAVAVTILDTGISRMHPLLEPALAADDMHAFNQHWGTHDDNGHGTKMAGLALYGCLYEAHTDVDQEPIRIPYRLESAKILPPIADNDDANHAVLAHVVNHTVLNCEIQAPHRKRVICQAVTTAQHQTGEPSSYSAAIDQLAFGPEDDDKRLFTISAGNVAPDDAWLRYPASNHEYGIEQPAQAWNALTIGAYTVKHTLPGTADYAGWSAVASAGGLSPFSATSRGWGSDWPIKPEVLFEGGNVATDPLLGQAAIPRTLQLLTTSRTFHVQPTASFSMTSAATAQAARLAAQLYGAYPDMWPETVRGMMVHHAEWTREQKAQYLVTNKIIDKYALLRTCGYGVPDPVRTLNSLKNSVTVYAQETITPYRKEGTDGKMNEMQFFSLPWPREALIDLAETPVRLRITLSYFVEPSPGKRGWTNRYRYASHGLRFDLRRNNESKKAFNQRVNYAMRDDKPLDTPEDSAWILGSHMRHLGSVHSDIWQGSAVDLADRDVLAVYPVVGWWRQRLNRGRCNTQARFSLIISLEVQNSDFELHNYISGELKLKGDLDLG